MENKNNMNKKYIISSLFRCIAVLMTVLGFICISAESRFLFFGREKTEHEIKVENKVRQLKDKDPAKRIKAAKELIKLEGKKASPELIKHLKKENNPRARADISEELGYIRDKQAAKDLIELIRAEKNSAVRQTQALALGQTGNPEAVIELKRIFLDENEALGVRLQAGNALSYIQNKESLEVLEDALENDNTDIRLQAVVSLGNMGDFKINERKKLIQGMGKDPDDRVKKYAADIIKERFNYKLSR
jgi:HEAT repeat protein